MNNKDTIFTINGIDMFFSDVTKKQSKQLIKMLTNDWNKTGYRGCNGTVTTHLANDYFTITCMFDENVELNNEEIINELVNNRTYGIAVCDAIQKISGDSLNYNGSEFYVENTTT